MLWILMNAPAEKIDLISKRSVDCVPHLGDAVESRQSYPVETVNLLVNGPNALCLVQADRVRPLLEGVGKGPVFLSLEIIIYFARRPGRIIHSASPLLRMK